MSLKATPDIILGINNCFAVKRFTEPEQWLRIVKEDFELDTVQLSLDLLPPAALSSQLVKDRITETVATAKKIGVTVHSIFTGLAAYSSNMLLSPDAASRDAAQSWYEDFIDLGKLAGVKSVGGHIAAYTVADFQDSERRDELFIELGERMGALANYAERAGLESLLFENMAHEREPGSLLTQAQEMDQQFAETRVPWQLCFDLGHPVAMATSDGEKALEDWFRHPWKTTPMLQLQQSNYGSDSHGNFVLEGEQNGSVTAQQTIAEVRKWSEEEVRLFIEVIPAFEADDDAVIAELGQSVQYWKRALAL